MDRREFWYHRIYGIAAVGIFVLTLLAVWCFDAHARVRIGRVGSFRPAGTSVFRSWNRLHTAPPKVAAPVNPVQNRPLPKEPVSVPAPASVPSAAPVIVHRHDDDGPGILSSFAAGAAGAMAADMLTGSHDAAAQEKREAPAKEETASQKPPQDGPVITNDSGE